MNFTCLIRHEEGWREKPYLCSEGYPTVGYGFRLGPKGAALSNYTFTLPLAAGGSWLQSLAETVFDGLDASYRTQTALRSCLQADGVDPHDWEISPRASVLVSMAYQMGTGGVLKFVDTLKCMADMRWEDASERMLRSRWAVQTPERAKRHADQIRTGVWNIKYGRG